MNDEDEGTLLDAEFDRAVAAGEIVEMRDESGTLRGYCTAAAAEGLRRMHAARIHVPILPSFEADA